MSGEEGKSTVLAAVDDIFFWTRIESVARGLRVQAVQASNAQKLEEYLEAHAPDLILLDLNSVAFSPLDFIRRIKNDPRLERTPLVAFLSHVQTDLAAEAREAGCENVLPRSAFTRNLAQILRMAEK